MRNRSFLDLLLYGAIVLALGGFAYLFVVNNRTVWAEKGWWPTEAVVEDLPGGTP